MYIYIYLSFWDYVFFLLSSLLFFIVKLSYLSMFHFLFLPLSRLLTLCLNLFVLKLRTPSLPLSLLLSVSLSLSMPIICSFSPSHVVLSACSLVHIYKKKLTTDNLIALLLYFLPWGFFFFFKFGS